ncbi:hypothetical protein GGD41_006986 [Paraburkholderia bryophila]|uniref:Uncharacterized protein n=1 Tax=Paraburkholderia bryophila TaxID=420952 RepID=A0A7Z0B479_9BURK|nr:hypothetical protein [Paraburkholderia bryophila]
MSAELENGKGEPLDWVPRGLHTPAGSTVAHTEADPVASRSGRGPVADAAAQVKAKAQEKV